MEEEEREELRKLFTATTGKGYSMPMWADTSFTEEYTLWLEEQIINQKSE